MPDQTPEEAVNARVVALHRQVLAQPLPVDVLAFYGHRGSGVGTHLFSQWARVPFRLDGQRYETAEQAMMVAKARLFGDKAAEQRILASSDPRVAKSEGRRVAGYDDEAWSHHRLRAVTRAGYAKFHRHPQLRDLLLGTGDRVLVEAAPRDPIWGIGLGATNPAVADPAKWRGTNLLGFSLMLVRDELLKRGSPTTGTPEGDGRAP